jgi:glyoxylase-like metal-dependent hydrolase (beta-lactamase superfamily II)
MPLSEIAAGVHTIEVGTGITRSNVYFVDSGSSWVLIDTGSANCGRQIQEAADSLFGPRCAPEAILLTHDHPDHAGSTRELAETWRCPVYLHPDELPLATVDEPTFFSTYDGYTTSSGRWTAPPLDRWIVLPAMHLVPRRRRAAMLAGASFRDAARALDPSAGLPGLPDWQCIPTPGHTPGHVAFFRPADRVLIAGDAVVTVDLNSPGAFLQWARRRSRQRLSGPPWYTTWSWRTARQSVAFVERIDPLVVASGHGLPMGGAGVAQELRALADRYRTAGIGSDPGP